jgi:hypothetical protein
MSWIKKYAISCLIALFALAAIDAYHHPGNDVRVGAVVLVAAVWPIALSIIVGSAVGEIIRERA